jgi:hypothetical protein
MKEQVPAILEAFYPGEQQGLAVADILLGRANPSGRFSMTVPRSAGHIPTVHVPRPRKRGVDHNIGKTAPALWCCEPVGAGQQLWLARGGRALAQLFCHCHLFLQIVLGIIVTSYDPKQVLESGIIVENFFSFKGSLVHFLGSGIHF